MNERDALGHWVAGLTDGEGCFFMATRRRRIERYPGRLFRSVVFTFGIALRADDRATLDLVQKMFGIGRIDGRYNQKFLWRGKERSGRPQFCFKIEAKADIPKVIAFFRRYPLRSKKRLDFHQWAAAFEIYSRAISATPLTTVRKGVEMHGSRVCRRPLVGTPRQRFRAIPDSVFSQLVRHEQAIRAGRRFA